MNGHQHHHANHDDSDEARKQLRLERVTEMLASHFGNASIVMPDQTMEDAEFAAGEVKDEPAIVVRVDDLVARVDIGDFVRSFFAILGSC